MKDKTKCPFCGQQIIAVYFWKGDDWTCGCFNSACKIRPMTKCMSTEEEARQEWNDAFVSDRRR